jgi:hypothetical protein
MRGAAARITDREAADAPTAGISLAIASSSDGGILSPAPVAVRQCRAVGHDVRGFSGGTSPSRVAERSYSLSLGPGRCPCASAAGGGPLLGCRRHSRAVDPGAPNPDAEPAWAPLSCGAGKSRYRGGFRRQLLIGFPPAAIIMATLFLLRDLDEPEEAGV